ncbi:HotDog domain-containing protein [Aspergillus heterothallicus]
MTLFRKPPSQTTSTSRVVEHSHLASRITPLFPSVLSTSNTLELMDLVSGQALEPVLNAGETSVIYTVSLTHSKPVSAGVVVTAISHYLGREGQGYKFRVLASDVAGEVARAEIVRLVVEKADVERRAIRRQLAAV